MDQYLIGIYKDPRNKPDVIKINNQKEYLEELLDGEFTTIDYDDYVILYKKNSEHLLPNIYVDQYSKIGVSLRGKVFAVNKDEDGKFKSLNKEQAKKCITFFLKKAFNNKNFDDNGSYITKSKRKKMKQIFKNNSKSNEKQIDDSESKKEVEKQEIQEQNKQPQPEKKTVSINDMSKSLNLDNKFFENQVRLEKVESKDDKKDAPNLNENAKSDIKEQSSTSNSPSPTIQLSDNDMLGMILKITLLILNFVQKALEDDEEDDE